MGKKNKHPQQQPTAKEAAASHAHPFILVGAEKSNSIDSSQLEPIVASPPAQVASVPQGGLGVQPNKPHQPQQNQTKPKNKAKLKEGGTESDEVSNFASSEVEPNSHANRKQKRPISSPPSVFANFRLSDAKYWVIGVAFLFALILLKSQEEAFNVGSGINVNQGQDYYELLGLSKSAEASEIRRAYKKLAVQLHPDKNTECKECAEKFGQIAVAYETLSNPEKRKVYDKVKGGFDLIPSDHSLTLTSLNFQVTSSADVWIVQTYSDTDSGSRHFAPFWEAVAADLHGSVKFGRINVNTDRDALALLPIKVRAQPTVLLLTRDHYPSIFPLTDLSKEAFRKWIEVEVPDQFGVVSGDKPVIRLETNSGRANFEQKLAAFNWRAVFDFQIAKGSVKRAKYFLPDGTEASENSAGESIKVLSRNFQVQLNPDMLERLCRGVYCFGFSQKRSDFQKSRNFQAVISPCMSKELGEAWVYDWDGELVAKGLKPETAASILDSDDPEAVEDLFFKPYPRSSFGICGSASSVKWSQYLYALVTTAAALGAAWWVGTRYGMMPVLYLVMASSVVMSLGPLMARR